MTNCIHFPPLSSGNMKNFLALFLGFLAGFSSFAFAQDCTPNWEVFSSEPYVEKAFPDTNVTYWRYRFEVPENSTTGLKISGKFPYSRYMNYNVYDQKTLDTAGSLPDREILPEDGSKNPFLENADRKMVQRDYSTWIVPSAYLSMPLPNILPLPNGQYVEVWYRVYAPDKGKDKNGGVALPTIKSIDLLTGEETACPKAKALKTPPFLAFGSLPPGTNRDKIEFYRPKPGGFYPNKDNTYLVGFLSSDRKDVNVIQMRVPTFAKTDPGEPFFSDKNETRYWSLCSGGVSQKTADCMRDFHFKQRKDGFITAVVGPASIREKVEARGLNFINRGEFVFSVMIYRNLLAQENFVGNQRKVPMLPAPELFNEKERRRYAAQNYIGDYAPQGQSCSVETFLAELEIGKSTLCNVPSGL